MYLLKSVSGLSNRSAKAEFNRQYNILILLLRCVCGYLLKLTILRIPPSRKERITQHNIIHPFCRWIIQHVRINEKEHWQVYLFSSQQLLFFETETFYFCKVWRNLYSPDSTQYMLVTNPHYKQNYEGEEWDLLCQAIHYK